MKYIITKHVQIICIFNTLVDNPLREVIKLSLSRHLPNWNCSKLFSSVALPQPSFISIALITICTVHLGPVVQSIISLTNSLRGQLVKSFMS